MITSIKVRTKIIAKNKSTEVIKYKKTLICYYLFFRIRISSFWFISHFPIFRLIPAFYVNFPALYTKFSCY